MEKQNVCKSLSSDLVNNKIFETVRYGIVSLQLLLIPCKLDCQ